MCFSDGDRAKSSQFGSDIQINTDGNWSMKKSNKYGENILSCLTPSVIENGLHLSTTNFKINLEIS